LKESGIRRVLESSIDDKDNWQQLKTASMRLQNWSINPGETIWRK